MKRISLNATLNYAYRVIDENVLGIKASVISICSEIDRYFRLRFELDISSEEVNSEMFWRITNVFPNLRGLNLSQFNQLLDVFTSIRDINAHLYLCKDISISDDLCQYLKSIVDPMYDISKDGLLTMYGQSYVLSFLSQKYNIWPFYITYYKRNYFEELALLKDDKIALFQVECQHLMQQYCGIGKPINTTSISSMEYQFLNELFKKYMTKIMFSIEKECSYTKKSTAHARSLSSYLNSAYEFDYDNEAYNLVIYLRNCWFHGTLLDEVVKYDDIKRVFSFEFVMNSFIRIKSVLKKNEYKFCKTIGYINEFANAVLNYYILRMVELSYKVLDSRLLTEDKVESRIQGLNKAFVRFSNTDVNYLDLAGKLIDPEYMEFSVTASKFLDKMPRKTICDNLKIIRLHSASGLEIGEYKTYQQDLYLVSIDLEEQFQNTINGKYLDEFETNNIIKYGSKISVAERIESTPINSYHIWL